MRDLLGRARALRTQGAFREAADAYRAAYASDPHGAEGRTALVALGGLLLSELNDPAGALAAPTTLSISPTTNTTPNAIGSAYSLTPGAIAFARPAQVVFNYSADDLAATAPGEDPRAGRWAGQDKIECGIHL